MEVEPLAAGRFMLGAFGAGSCIFARIIAAISSTVIGEGAVFGSSIGADSALIRLGGEMGSITITSFGAGVISKRFGAVGSGTTFSFGACTAAVF